MGERARSDRVPREVGMSTLALRDPGALSAEVWSGAEPPALVTNSGDRASWRFAAFFLSAIRNPNTRASYYRAVMRFLGSFEAAGFSDLAAIESAHIGQYIDSLEGEYSAPSVKLHLAAIRRFFNWMATGGFLAFNPAAAIQGPRLIIRKGKTPVLDAEQTRQLLDALPTGSIVGLRDRALIGTMVYTFGRVSAVIGMNVEDFYMDGRRPTFRLAEKGGKEHTVPAHHNAIEYVGAYLDDSGLAAIPRPHCSKASTGAGRLRDGGLPEGRCWR